MFYFLHQELNKKRKETLLERKWQNKEKNRICREKITSSKQSRSLQHYFGGWGEQLVNKVQVQVIFVI